MKVRVDPARCQQHTLCSINAPAAFELNDVDGHATAIAGEVPGDQQEQVREAVRSCPERAISLA
ncbi:ferredoxin [Nocardia sp. NPDC005745]|uniref:ferredoxin n=1 Tax=Nocardia sp. NPDC005745 TaxID=3157061 RepID=UPI0033F8CC01